MPAKGMPASLEKMISAPSGDQPTTWVRPAPRKVSRRDGPPTAGITYTSGPPSSRPVKASSSPSGERAGRRASPGFAVSRRATPPPASTVQRSSSHTNTTESPWIVGKR